MGYFKQWLDAKIQLALKENIQTIQENGSYVVEESNSLLIWLYIAWYSASKDSPSYSQLFSYQFIGNETLADFLLKSVDENVLKYDAQTYTKNLVVLWNTQKNKDTQLFQPTHFSLFQRFILWVFEWFPPDSLAFTGSGFTDATVLVPLRERNGEINSPKPSLVHKNLPGGDVSLPEKYTPRELLTAEKITSLLSHPDEFKAFSGEANPISPVDIKQANSQLSTVIELVQNQIANVQQVVFFDQQQAGSELAFDLSNQTNNQIEQQQWIDQSDLIEATKMIDLVEERREWNTRNWVNRFGQALSKKARLQYGETVSIEIKISSLAQDIIIHRIQDTFLHGNDVPLDLAHLPLGFFIDETREEDEKSVSKIIYTLKFSEEKYETQKANSTLAAMELDPFAIPEKTKLTADEPNDFTVDILGLLKQRKIAIYDKKQIQFLEKIQNHTLLQDKDYGHYRAQSLNPVLFKALVRIIQHPNSTPTHILTIINTFKKFHEIDYPIITYSPDKRKRIPIEINGITRWQDSPDLLYYFVNRFLGNGSNISGNEFHSPEAMEYLRKLAANENPVILRLFKEITDGVSGINALSFVQTARRVFYFFDFLSTRGIHIPLTYDLPDDQACDRGSPLASPESVMDCLVKIERHPRLFAWISKRIHELPGNLTEAKKLLDLGYSFVHIGMRLDNNNLPHDISAENLQAIDQNTSPQIKLAMYLRYLAYHVDDQSAQQILEKLENKVGPLSGKTESEVRPNKSWNPSGQRGTSNLNAYLKSNWKKMVQEVLALPTRVDLAIPTQGNLPKVEKLPMATADPSLFLYPEKNMEIFINQLSSQDSQIPWENIKALIQEASDAVPLYANASGDLLQAEALLFRLQRLNREDHPEKYEKILQKISELLYKINLHQESGLTPISKNIITKIHKISESPNKEGIKALVDNEVKQVLKSNPISDDELVHCICLMRQLYYRFTLSASNEEPKQGKWLRLEQFVSIILGFRYDITLQIDTSEGKTLIIGWAALLDALLGRQPDIITHNAAFAEKTAKELSQMTRYFDVNVGYQTAVCPNIPSETDILCVDIATAVLSDLSQQAMDQEKNNLIEDGSNKRIRFRAYCDEADVIGIDIETRTTMQISEAVEAADQNLIDNLSQFHEWIETETPDIKSFEAFCQKFKFFSEEEFHFWSNAKKLAENLKENHDYVIHEDPARPNHRIVYIVHKETTGCVDKVSKWGNGVHTYLSFIENQNAQQSRKNYQVTIPGISQVKISGNPSTYLEQYQSRRLFTGTLGNAETTEALKKVGQSKHVIRVPRAQRPETEAFAWPIVSDGQKSYSRAYRFSPMICESDEAHFNRLLSAIQTIQAQGKSCLVFWNTIKECDQFSDFLQQQGIDVGSIQIFDDAKDVLNQDPTLDNIRPSADVIVARTQEEKMITLGTAVAGRGVDFKNVSYAIMAKPSLKRVTQQKAGRVARDSDFGVIYEIYSKEDFPNFAQDLADFKKLSKETNAQQTFNFFEKAVEQHGDKLEQQNLTVLSKKI